PSTTPSGFLGVMPLALIVGRGDQAILEGIGTTTLDERDVILSDARDLDPGEREALAGSNVNHLASFDELLTLPLPDRPLHVHFDTDVIDPEQAPAMNYPAPGGPSADTVRAVFRRLAQSGRVAAVSVSSWNPDLDQDGRTRRLVMDLLSELAPEPPESTS
ncbi:MAG: arginase family protein, partial [Anaerolineae bacterium]